MGRVGTIRTKSGSFRTPHMLPVVDPNRPLLGQEALNNLGVHAVMTNAYLLRRARIKQSTVEDIHETLGFHETVATDSGAYQILEYGRVSVEPGEIVRYQEDIGADIGVILDVPTGFHSGPDRSRWTVDETVRRADEALKIRRRQDVLWVGPVQGGVHLREVARSAREMGKRDFDIYALGSPTELMESQRFDVLVDMILAAKRELPPSKPLHLFGAGHPALFPFIVALGCDLFDSAAYALCARTGRYLTSEGTLQLSEMEEFPCSCSMCGATSPREVLRLRGVEQGEFLSHHNLQSCFSELRSIREAIRKGRLWDLLELRAHSHPSLKRCLQRIAENSAELERWTPVVKPRGIFYFGPVTDKRPECVRYALRIERTPVSKDRIAILFPGRWRRPYREDPRHRTMVDEYKNKPDIQILFYTIPFGPVPLELDETYPIAQTESLDPKEKSVYVGKARLVAAFVKRLSPRLVFLIREGELGTEVYSELSKIFRSRLVTIEAEGLSLPRFNPLFKRRAATSS